VSWQYSAVLCCKAHAQLLQRNAFVLVDSRHDTGQPDSRNMIEEKHDNICDEMCSTRAPAACLALSAATFSLYLYSKLLALPAMQSNNSVSKFSRQLHLIGGNAALKPCDRSSCTRGLKAAASR
jgi:hypothetical protein